MLILAGCGGSAPPRSRPVAKIPAAVATRLAADAAAVALAPGCTAHAAAARLQADAIASISRVPSRYREPLMSAANEIAGRATACSPPKKEHPKPPGERKPPKHKHHGHD